MGAGHGIERRTGRATHPDRSAWHATLMRDRAAAPSRRFYLAVGAATAAAHIGNNFSTFLIGGLIDARGFTPLQMGAWSMAETLAYAAAMFGIAPRVASLSPRRLMLAASALVVLAQLVAAAGPAYVLLTATRVATGLGFGLINTALNLAAARAAHPTRALAIGIALQTFIYAAVNVALPLAGTRYGVAGMFVALAALSALFALPGLLLSGGGRTREAADGRAAASRMVLDRDGARVLVAMALFTYGSLAVWPFMERAAHAIAIPATAFGRYQGIATLASALGSLVLAAAVSRLRRAVPLTAALAFCGAACATLTTTEQPLLFAAALTIFNVAWFTTYPLIMGIAYATDPAGRLAVLCTAVWLAMTSLGSLTTGAIAQIFDGYTPVGPLGLALCLAAAAVVWPLARRLDGHPRAVPSDAPPPRAG
jgi:predicted MFS family arabinose efflux permease